jgi:hypothetical protein
MGEASFHIGNNSSNALEEESQRLREEITAIRQQLSIELAELDRRRREATVKIRKFSVYAAGAAVGALLLFSILPLRSHEG